MSEAKHPYWARAEALAQEHRFCEWLDATAALDCGWPHSPVSARRWLREACEVESLGHLAVSSRAAGAFQDVERRFAVWNSNQELAL